MFTMKRCISGGYRLVDVKTGDVSGLMSLKQARKLTSKAARRKSRSKKVASPW